MTKEDIVKRLDRIRDEDTWTVEAFQALTEAMAAVIRDDARQKADGCEGCKYQAVPEWKMPCSGCKRQVKDYWEPIETDKPK